MPIFICETNCPSSRDLSREIAKVFRLIAEDPLYKPDTFRKAQRILDREQLAAAADREAFGAFVLRG